MGFRYCRYCEKIEGNLLLMYEYIDSKGKLIIDDVHIACKKKDDLRIKKEGLLNKVKLKKCYFCGIQEPDKTKVNKHGNHLSCSENSIKERKKIERLVNKSKKDLNYVSKKKTILDRILEAPDRKICNRCKDDKHISEFYQKRNMSYYGHCKKCHNIETKKWSNKNKEKVKNYNKSYSKIYFNENKDKIYAQNKKRRLKNNNQPKN